MLLATGALLAAGPKFNANQELQRPTDYRNWIFLTSGLGMSYGPAAREMAIPPFDNVFVEPKAHAAFLKTGHWPEGTMFVLELRRSVTGQSINKTGRSQSEVVAIEMAVKDKRYPDGWGYFDFPANAASKAALPQTADCYSCHKQNTAVENTFVQFYPTLIEVARAKGVLKAAYLDTEKQAEKK
jgi:hypothetical protein